MCIEITKTSTQLLELKNKCRIGEYVKIIVFTYSRKMQLKMKFKKQDYLTAAKYQKVKFNEISNLYMENYKALNKSAMN